MKTACIQMDMLFAQPEENFAKAKRLIREAMASGPDVVVLPETWNTGFFPREDLASLCDRDCAQTRMVFGALAKELGVNLVAGSVANARGGRVYNTACVFDRNGDFAGTIKDVIYESGQFSPAGSGWLDSVIANGAIPSSCYEAADAALAGENPIGSAMYFNTGSGRGVKIGAHQFY